MIIQFDDKDRVAGPELVVQGVRFTAVTNGTNPASPSVSTAMGIGLGANNLGSPARVAALLQLADLAIQEFSWEELSVTGPGKANAMTLRFFMEITGGAQESLPISIGWSIPGNPSYLFVQHSEFQNYSVDLHGVGDFTIGLSTPNGIQPIYVDYMRSNPNARIFYGFSILSMDWTPGKPKPPGNLHVGSIA